MYDTLAITSVDAKGYGRIYKLVMREPYLHILAKSIYAYFCAYAGNGTKAFPKREKILRDLQMNKDTYTKYLNMLVASDFIIKQRTSTGNLYTINLHIPLQASEAIISETTDILKVCNVKSKGFGTVPKLAMLDHRLSAQAKAIYAYFCSFAGAGAIAFPHKTTILKELGISERTYYTHFAQLTAIGYITVSQRKTNGRFDVSEYMLNEEIASPAPHGLSEKLQYGGFVESFTPNPVFAPISEILQSEKVVPDIPQSEILEPQNFGHTNIKNNSTSNNLLVDNEQVDNQQVSELQRLSFCCEKDVRNAIGFYGLMKDAEAGCELKVIMGHFSDEADQAFYLRQHIKIIKQMSRQLFMFFGRTDDFIRVNNRFYASEQMRQNLIKLIYFDEIRMLCADLANRYRDIQDVPRYVRKVLYQRACLELADISINT